MGSVSLYIRDDLLEKIDDRVERSAEVDRAKGLAGRQVTNRSKLLEQLIESSLDSAARFSTSHIEEVYGSLVFNDRVQREYLSAETYAALRETVEGRAVLSRETADAVAAAMKDWAISKGATHYTHWFQPLSGTTSEKHEGFVEPCGDGSAITSFSGKELFQGEADGSSFPSGGLRATFEARGYTAWDPTSYAFIKAEVLCIPTAFCSYTGEALDEKTPLLRSMDALSAQVKRTLAHFGTQVRQVDVSLGAEQEFFLIPERDYAAREDLVLCGRTLFGAEPCKGQELEEHYYGSIRPTVNNFLKELDDELWALGIAAKTKHNEVAPAQHELAPIFTACNRGVDENLLTMEKMTLLAGHHGLACLLAEKPFAGINGSGKHNNWSVTADGENLLDPGDDPLENLRFLVMMAAIMQAVDDYQELLRMSVASAGNDHRLGANEAPPAIVSIYLGDDLSNIVSALINDTAVTSAEKMAMSLGVSVLPAILRDNSDRNRTSPFAFTGNKFEFRMPGSNMNLSFCNTVLNTAVAKSLSEFADAMDAATQECFEEAALAWVKATMAAHERIVFNGNGYAAEWEAEAARRGLANNKNTASALPCMVAPETVALFGSFGVLSETELGSRYEVKLETYNKLINIEARVMQRMTRRTFLPAINRYLGDVARQIANCETVLGGAAAQGAMAPQRLLLGQLTNGVSEICRALGALDEAAERAKALADQQQRANCSANEVVPAMQALRAAVDAMETITSRDYWPVPSYNNMLFYV